MLAIRLARVGTNKKPFYRIIVCEKSRDNYGRALEILGTYNPFSKDLQVKTEKIKDWVAKGAKLTPTLNNLFIDKKIIDKGEKIKSHRLNTEKLTKKRAEAENKAKAEAEAGKKDEKEAKIEAPAVKTEETGVESKEVAKPEIEASSVAENPAPEAENKAENT